MDAVGVGTDASLLAKLDKNVSDPVFKALLPQQAFQVKHYAGLTTYNIDQFLEKNRDSLADLVRC